MQRVRRIQRAAARLPAALGAAVTTTLHRVAAATFPECVPLLLPTLVQLRTEFAARGYPTSAFNAAVRAFAHRPHLAAAVWRALFCRYRACVRAAPYQPP